MAGRSCSGDERTLFVHKTDVDLKHYQTLPASSAVAAKNPDSFIKTSAHKLLSGGWIIHVQHRGHVIHMHVDWLGEPAYVIRVQIRILIGCREDERLEWVPGHCVASHLHDNFT